MTNELDATWLPGPTVAEVRSGTIRELVLQGRNYILVRVGDQFNLFRNGCSHMGMPLDTADLDEATGMLVCPWHSWCYDARTGDCLTVPGLELEPLPLQIVDGQIWVKPQ